MTQTRQHPDIWYSIAALLVALRRLLQATAPEQFAAVAQAARIQLAVVTALVRRYIHILAADLGLSPLPHLPDPVFEDAPSPDGMASGRWQDYRFPLIERPARSGPRSREDDPPALQWQILMEAVGRLVSVLANPAPHALRLARRLRRWQGPALRELPVPWHIIRRLDPALDTFMNQVDALARPDFWAGLDTS